MMNTAIETTSQLKLVPEAYIPAFATGDNATFTVVSRTTGVRFTYRVRAPKEADGLRFVSVLNGPNNEADYIYLGVIDRIGCFRQTKGSKVSKNAPSVLAFAWLWTCVQAKQFSSIEVYHHGKCCRCGRKLTVPSSIEMGIGPECASK